MVQPNNLIMCGWQNSFITAGVGVGETWRIHAVNLYTTGANALIKAHGLVVGAYLPLSQISFCLPAFLPFYTT